MYLSVLQAAHLHRESEGLWGIHLPANQKEDPCNLRHTFAYLRQELEDSADKRIPLPKLYAGLARPPFGVRQGLMPLLVAVFFSAHAHEIAFYERGTFIADVNGDMFLRLTKVPEIFELQWCRIEGLRAEVLEGLRQVVSLPPAKSKRTHLLEIVSPLCRFAASLPEYSKRTRQLSSIALATRDALFNTREPVKLLMHQLPEACGLTPFAPGAAGQAAAAQIYVRQLHIALRELEGAYSELLKRSEKRLAFQFRLGELPSEQAREQIIQRAKQLKPHLREPRLVAFTNALSDVNLLDKKWMASLASIIVTKTPATWIDADESRFDTELSDLIGCFLRVERLHLGELTGTKNGQAFRVAITQADGDEVAEVLHFSSDDEVRLRRLDKKLDDLFSQEGDVALVATARQLGRRLSRK